MIQNNDNNKQIILDNLKNGATYFDILLYNCKNEDQSINILNKDKLNTSLDDIVEVYDKLFNFGLTLSGFQFIGLTLERNLKNDESFVIRLAYFILSSGFLTSLFGSLLSFIVIEYIKGIRDESEEFIITGIKKYKTIFKLADVILYLDSILFVVPINIMIYNVLDFFFGIIFNISSLIFFILGIYFHYTIIISRQTYILKNVNDTYNSDICNCNNWSNFSFNKLWDCLSTYLLCFDNSDGKKIHRKIFKTN